MRWNVLLVAVGLVLCFVVELYGQDIDSTGTVTLLLFGDVNLGRSVGQELVKGNIDYPFQFVKDSLSRADIVFANLESQLTDQNGETQHPKYNLIFCAPPSGTAALKQAHINIVSTANNHAFDYRLKGLVETIRNLQSEGIRFTGTSVDTVAMFSPAVIATKGVRIGFLGYTQFVNIPGRWQGKISLFDEERAKREIGDLRNKADFIIASFHGGGEYVERPNRITLQQLRSLADAGADLVIGHHPHVPQGIERYKDKCIFYSLGNFVFYQPQLEWTQKGLGVELTLKKDSVGVQVSHIRLLPLRASKQPSFLVEEEEQRVVIERVKQLSNIEIIEEKGSYFVGTTIKKP